MVDHREAGAEVEAVKGMAMEGIATGSSSKDRDKGQPLVAPTLIVR
jgi:hypothetical protein